MTKSAIFSIAFGAAVLAAACAQHPSTAARDESCRLRDEDAAYSLARGPLYRACAVDRKATLSSQDVHPDMNTSLPIERGTRCYSTDLEFVVDTAGVPEAETAHVVKASDQAFGDAWLKMVPRLRYEPARRNGVAVRQIVDEHFTAATATVLVRGGGPPPGASSAPMLGRPAC